MTTTSTDHGTLTDYITGDAIRPATADELAQSLAAAQKDGGAGAIDLDGRTVFVAGGE
jgi:1,4-dihydroxy-2-naphthoyl-CoA synthase